MLQPRQLQEVSARYPGPIAEVRDFLLKAGSPVNTPQALADITARLGRDRGFHRDLISHIWVVLDRANGQIASSDLLGILAVAAAGPYLAAEASDDAAHGLLRFLMDARRSLESFTTPAPPAQPAPQTASQHIPSQPIAAVPRPAPAPQTAPGPRLTERTSRETSATPTPLQAEPTAPARPTPVRQPEPVSSRFTPPQPPHNTPGEREQHDRAFANPIPVESSSAVPSTSTDPAPLPSLPAAVELRPQPRLRPNLRAITPPSEPIAEADALYAEPAVPIADTAVSYTPVRDRSKLYLALGIAAACLIALALGAWYLHINTSNVGEPYHSANTPAPIVQGSTNTSAPTIQGSANQGSANSPAPSNNLSTLTAPDTAYRKPSAAYPLVPQPPPYRTTVGRQAGPTPNPTRALAAASASRSGVLASTATPRSLTAPTPNPTPSPATSFRATQPSPALTVPATPSSARPATPAPIVRTPSRNAAPTIVPAETLRKRLDSPTIPADSLLQNQLTADGRKYPRLLRRKPGQLAPDNDGEYVAELRPADIPGMPTTRGGRSASTPQGTVHPTVLGMMAGNVLYSPAPVYPAAASAARVQGQVKIQAQVDRDGNVSWARVVSGPPLLRDAALDAVQHWRYRPYLAHGKPAPASADAVLDFELQ